MRVNGSRMKHPASHLVRISCLTLAIFSIGDAAATSGQEKDVIQTTTESSVQAEDSSSELPKGYRRVSSDKVEDLRSLCRATAETGLFSGAVLVADQGEVIYKEAFGLANREWNIPNTVDTRFRLASVSKQFCTMVVMQLVQEGKVDLDDTITDHLSYYRPDTGNRITIHHLMSHQSGLKDFTAAFNYRGNVSRLPFGKDEFIKEYCSSDLVNEPGTIYSYCNAGYCILGRIIEKVTGRTFERNVQERIFEPLDMAHSGYDRNRYLIEKRASGYTRGPFGYENADYIDMDTTPGAAGSLYSTVEDMFRWDRALYTGKLLNAEHRKKLFTPNRDVPEVKAAGGRPHSVYGYGWQIYTRTHPVTKRRTRVVNHGGAINGFRAMENRLVEDDAFVIVLCNQGDGLNGSEVWNAVTRLSVELIHVVTEQPYRMPGKPRLTQDQRMYQMVRNDGVEAALEWFDKNGKKAAWGGTFAALAQRLIDDGRVEEGLTIMQRDLEMSPGKVWLIRKTAQAFLENGKPREALSLAEKGLQQRPEDERFLEIQQAAAISLGDDSATEGGDEKTNR